MAITRPWRFGQQPGDHAETGDIIKWILIALVIIVVVVILVLLAIYAGGSFPRKGESGETTTVWAGYGKAPGSGPQPLTIENAQLLKPKELKSKSLSVLKKVCKTYKKKLPVPRTDLDMKQLSETIKEYHQDTDCDYYAIGVTLKSDVRYKSLDGKVKWPALSTKKNPGIPKEGDRRDCASVTVAAGAVEITDTKQCDASASFTCLLIHDETNNCSVESKSECIVDAKLESEETSLVAAWKAATKSQKKAQNIVFVDKENILEDFKNVTATSCTAHQVTYVLDYVDSYTQLPNKAIKIDKIQDPELECVHVEGDTLALSRVGCEDVGCPICF